MLRHFHTESYFSWFSPDHPTGSHRVTMVSPLGLTKHRIQSHQTPALWKGHGIPGPNLQHPQDPRDYLSSFVREIHGEGYSRNLCNTSVFKRHVHAYMYKWFSVNIQGYANMWYIVFAKKTWHIYRTWNALHNSFTLQHKGFSIGACMEMHLLAGNGTFKHWDLVKHD